MKSGEMKRDLIFTMGLLVFSLAITFSSFIYSWEGRILPFLTGVLASGLGIIVLIREFFPDFLRGLDEGVLGTTEELKKEDTTQAPQSIKLDEDEEIEASLRDFLAMAGWVIALAIAVFLVGFYIASALFALLYIRNKARASWVKAALVSIGICAVLYLFFELMLNLPLFRGLVFDDYIPPI